MGHTKRALFRTVLILGVFSDNQAAANNTPLETNPRACIDLCRQISNPYSRKRALQMANTLVKSLRIRLTTMSCDNTYSHAQPQYSLSAF